MVKMVNLVLCVFTKIVKFKKKRKKRKLQWLDLGGQISRKAEVGGCCSSPVRDKSVLNLGYVNKRRGQSLDSFGHYTRKSYY